MKFEKYIKIDDLSRQFALTNEQLLEYLFLSVEKSFLKIYCLSIWPIVE